MSRQTPLVYNIPAGIPFADALATGILEQYGDDPLKLTRLRVLLPTRRGCRNLRDAFLRLTDGKALLLPQMQPIGDIDEEELGLELTGHDNADSILNLPPSISPLRRKILLARAIMKLEDFTKGPDQAIALAEDLGRFLDQIHIEERNFADLANLVPDEFASHWQITLEFLEIISENWPEILAEQGAIDAADRRRRLIDALSGHWRDNPPDYPIIAAGSTGSMPATARLLHVISTLPQGCVVLPGLDTIMNYESWLQCSESHPQVTLKKLLAHMELEREAVKEWPYQTPSSKQNDEPPQLKQQKATARRRLASEMMRPAETAGAWMSLYQELSDKERDLMQRSLEDVRSFACENPRHEAELIALLLRETLEYPTRTAALITPDRNLARRVAMACSRWKIMLDDSGGIPLNQSPVGSFMRLALQTCQSSLAPIKLVSLLKHKFCAPELPELNSLDFRQACSILETKILRGPKPAPGFDGLRQRLCSVTIKPVDKEIISGLLDQLEPILTPLIENFSEGEHSFSKWLDIHIELTETLAGKQADTLWQDEDGEQAAIFLADLRDQAHALPHVNFAQYEAILTQLMAGVTVRPSFGTHPRLSILGQLESRLTQADLIILGGLNEGTWPPDPGHDPWMSRPMRSDFGLPGQEQGIGLSAHDFVQGFCAPHVVMTRSKRVEGTPTVPARWLQRLDTVLQALKIDPKILAQAPYFHYCKTLDDHGGIVTPASRPAPTPPLGARPRQLSVTQIEKLMRDPYNIYAYKVLKLKKLKQLEEAADAAIRGTIIHDVLDDFISNYPQSLPENAEDILMERGKEIIERELVEPQARDFWWPRFTRMADWFLSHEHGWREKAKPLETEIDGQISFSATGGDFTLTAKADRIDQLNDSSIAIIDYKTGTPPGAGDIRNGLAPQLPLEALIVAEGGFPGIPANDIGYLGFWKLSGGADPGLEKPVKPAKDSSLEELVEQTKDGLENLISIFDQEDTPYYSLPQPDRAPPKAYQDYAHLARAQEWADISDSEEATG